jgi:hypothetical protein
MDLIEQRLARTNITVMRDLPPQPKRWVPIRKAEIVTAVHSGAVSLEDACRHYAMSVEEFLEWKQNVEQYGLLNLRNIRAQKLRQASSNSTAKE